MRKTFLFLCSVWLCGFHYSTASAQSLSSDGIEKLLTGITVETTFGVANHPWSIDDLAEDGGELCRRLLDVMDRQSQVEGAARIVARYLELEYPPAPLIATLARALLREDAGFHAYQSLEAGGRQFHEWGDGECGRHVLVAVARFLAAHSPTERSQFQTASTARRLNHGGKIYEDDPAAAEATAGAP